MVDSTGTVHASIVDAAIDSFTWELNHWGSGQFHLATTLPATSECIPGEREVQLWYDPATGSPRCLWWGPIVSREAQQTGLTDIQCLGIEWYLSRLQLGPVLSNYLLDGDFENPALPNWTPVGTVTQSSDPVIVRRGARSLKLVSSAAGLDNYSTQTFSITAGASLAVAVFVRARFYLSATPSTPYIGPANMERGIYVRTISGGVTQTQVWTPLTNSAPRNEWVRMFAPAVSIPAGATQTVEVRFYSPGGQINWDTSIACLEESVGADTANTYADVNTIIANTLAYVQDPTKNKPNLSIAGPTGTLGVTLSRQYQFYDHGMMWDACLRPLIDAGYCDAWIGWDPLAKTRQLLTAVSRGSVKPQLALTLGGNAAIYAHRQDATKTAGAITILTQGMSGEKTIGKVQKAAEDIGYAVDTTANAGITFDEAISAVPETTLDGVAAQATTELARRKNLVTVPQWSVPADFVFAGGMSVGDTIPFRGGSTPGWPGAENSLRRVTTMSLVPNQANQVIVTGSPNTY